MSLPTLPPPDTHCFDDDAGTDCWSHSPAQMQAYGQVCREAVIEEVLDVIESENARRVVYTPDCIEIIRSLK